MRKCAVICAGKVELIYGITSTSDSSEQMSNPPRLMGMRCLMLSVDERCRAILKKSFRPPAITESKFAITSIKRPKAR